MKKLISLLLCVMMVASCLTFTAVASTDAASYVLKNPENEIEAGALAATRPGTNSIFASSYQKYFDSVSDVNVVVDENDANNRIFQIAGHSTVNVDNVLHLCLGGTNGMTNWSVRRFTSKVKFDSVTGGHADLYKMSGSDWTAAPTDDTFGVRFKNGGAYYYDVESAAYLPFIADGTMSADTWYRVDAIMDIREAAEKGVYMNAFVYDNSNNLVGTSGWKNVSTKTRTSYIGTKVQVRGFEEGESVWVDEIAAYQITNAPTYTMEFSSDAETNSYVTSNSSKSYRALIAPFNSNGNGSVVHDDEYSSTGDLTIKASTDRAARIEMDVRFPSLSNSEEFDIFSLYSGPAGLEGPSIYTDKKTIFEGTVNVNLTSLTVKSYNATTGLYDTPVTLEGGASSYTIEEDKWYTLVWDIDYTDSAAPVGMLYVKDAAGTVLAKSASAYAIQPMPQSTKYNQITNVILYIASYRKNREYNVDNTNIYKAVAMADLNSSDTRTKVVEDDFESYDDGTTYVDAVMERQSIKKAPNYWDTAAVIASEPVDFSAPLFSTDPVAFTFTYSNPVPVANISTNTVELYADGTKMVSGYTVTPGAADANNCTTSFVVDITGLSYGTDYSLRLNGEIADYNEALSGGIPAFTGAYDEITFSVAAFEAEFTTEGTLVDSEDAPIETATLNKGDTVKGKVTFADNGSSPYACYAIVAIYKGTKLVDVKKSELIVISSNAALTEAETPTITVAEDGVTAKLFVWNNFETMRPLIAPVVSGN